MISVDDIEIRNIEPGDSLAGLSVGPDPHNLPLKIFLNKQARKFHNANLARTYGAFNAINPKKPLAYITLVCGQIETQHENQFGDLRYTYDNCPAVKIARLAVDHRYKGQGIGKALIDFSLGIIRTHICPYVGCRFVVVDSKSSAVSFYENKCGFTILDTAANRALETPILFIDLHKA
ncbi:MAG: GNAT family N-acetyltransferase [Xanthobacteraceae bacterium]|nr:GNAT family N-acetyltransferase [Xanthobacteraceae bacterium]